MSNNKLHVDSYKKYICDNFPNSSIIKKFDDQHFYECYYSTQKVIQHCELCLDYLSDEYEKKFLIEIKNSFFELLYIFALHDEYITSAILRGISEAVLRLMVYHCYKKKLTYEMVKGFSYTTIKEYFCNDESKKLLSFQPAAGIYFDIFKIRSTKIHDPMNSIQNNQYLNEFMETSAEDYIKHMSKDMKKIWKFHLEKLTLFFDLNSKNISLPNKIWIDKNLNDREKNFLQ
ncbi:hypothetical protein [Enterococcus hirae]|uniref:hypothetical protein n=1 Tax=Enterococcus hirae TaxID=1354 RepID=UPI0027BFB628|nr:hypothetical protein [Enterococcus hirae]MDQ2183421.1 hypothetical protein [Enterococcus hirae]